MNLHPLSPDTPCPSCGQASLKYMESRSGDIYRCVGGCGRTVKHRRISASGACGIVTVVGGASMGHCVPCEAVGLDVEEGKVMRHHPIAPTVACPHCGRPGLVFVAMTHNADKYQCRACQHAVMHMSNGARSAGARGCGLRAVLHARYGPLKPCANLAPKGE